MFQTKKLQVSPLSLAGTSRKLRGRSLGALKVRGGLEGGAGLRLFAMSSVSEGACRLLRNDQ